jgi:hypothetical protein
MTFLRLSVCALFLLQAAVSEAGSISPFAFFKNSLRRTSTASESDHVVRFVKGCTAFFVKNSLGKTYLMTARHCAKMSIYGWCKAGGKFIDENSKEGKCQRVVASDDSHDIALVEATFPYTPSTSQPLSLAAYSPKKMQKLVMIGYPADAYRKGYATTTDRCWITEEDVASPHPITMSDRSAKHNCTTYGGNSGGPMIAEGTSIAVGLPFTYYPDNYTSYDEKDVTNHAIMAKMSDFVASHRATLLAAGVDIVDTDPGNP